MFKDSLAPLGPSPSRLRSVAEGTPCSSAPRTSSELVDKKRSEPKAAVYLYGDFPEQNAARVIPKLWAAIELKTLNPVSAEFLDSRMTSTRGSLKKALIFKIFFTRAKPSPGWSTSSSAVI